MHQTRVLRTLDSQTATRFARGLCMALDIMDQLNQLVEILVRDKMVCFSFLDLNREVRSVAVRECEDYDFLEYGEEFAPGTMFEVGPVHPSKSTVSTQLQFQDMQVAGNAVLKRRAESLGEPWQDV